MARTPRKRYIRLSDGMSVNNTVGTPEKASTSITAADPVKSSPNQVIQGGVEASSCNCADIGSSYRIAVMSVKKSQSPIDMATASIYVDYVII